MRVHSPTYVASGHEMSAGSTSLIKADKPTSSIPLERTAAKTSTTTQETAGPLAVSQGLARYFVATRCAIPCAIVLSSTASGRPITLIT